MSRLGEWLQAELSRRRLTQNAVAVYAGVGQATISGIIRRGHVPKAATLLRLADFFGTPREQVLHLAGYLPSTGSQVLERLAPEAADEPLVRELLEAFQQVPDEWKPLAVEQVARLRRLAELRPARLVGEE